MAFEKKLDFLPLRESIVSLSQKNPFSAAIDSSLVDAFVIGSRAREHLQTLTKDANITPKDIAQLSKILSRFLVSGQMTFQVNISDQANSL